MTPPAIPLGQRLRQRLHDRLSRDEWNLGIVAQPINDIVKNGITSPVRWFPANPWRIFADPFCVINDNGSVTILAEMLNHWIGRGEIWQANITAEADPLTAQFTPMMSVPSHLSYPFVVHENAITYMLAESHEAQALHLWQLDRSGQWHFAKTILHRPAIDATLWRGVSNWWLFCTFADDAPDEKLYLFSAKSLLEDWVPHQHNPIKTDRANARPGGALFWADGKLIRPAQNSSVTYGGSLVLNEIVSLSHHAFSERPYRELVPSGYYPDGIHTIAGAGSYTVIDGKRWHHGIGTALCRVSAKIDKIRRSHTAAHLQKWQTPSSILV